MNDPHKFNEATEKSAIDAVVRKFFTTFTNTDGKEADLSILHTLCVPGCVIVKTCGETPTVNCLADFIAPRQDLLSSGKLANFSEAEVWENTQIFGSIAQRFCSYEKSGDHCGDRFDAMGMKSIQLVKTDDGWRISSVIWDDERDGVMIPPEFTSTARVTR